MTRFLILGRALPVAAAALMLAGAARAAPAPATIVIGGKPVPFIVSPYVGEGGQVFAPVDAVRLLGADYVPDTQHHTVAVRAAGGKSITLPYEIVGGRYCVPIQKAAQALGASTDWQPATQTLTVRARLLMVRQDDDALTIYTSYPVYYHVQRIDGPNRLFVDLYGLDLAAQAATIPVSGNGSVLHIRSGQMGENTVRIVVDLRRSAAFRVQSPQQASLVRVALGGGGDVAPMSVPPVHVAGHPPVPPPALPAQGVHITGVSCRTTGALTQVLVTTTGQAKYSTEMLDNPRRLAFDLAGATLDTTQREVAADGNPVMKDVRTGYFQNADSRFGRVVVDLQRAVPFTVTDRPADGGGRVYAINLQLPPAPTVTLPPAGARWQPGGQGRRRGPRPRPARLRRGRLRR